MQMWKEVPKYFVYSKMFFYLFCVRYVSSVLPLICTAITISVCSMSTASVSFIIVCKPVLGKAQNIQ